jgi:hypothetical protein
MIIEKMNLISTGPEENRALFKRTSIKVRFSFFDPQCLIPEHNKSFILKNIENLVPQIKCCVANYEFF